MTPAISALAIGIAFGFTLERAGLGSARKLTGQFHLTDLTVFKVMFSAIVTAMLGTFWLDRAGLMPLAGLYVPDTYLPAQIGGGLIFGAGFALAGLCPGTSCVSAATGRGDGALVVLGMFGGVLLAGLAFPWLEPIYAAGPRGPLTLPQVLNAPYGVVVFAIAILALIGFATAERLESRPRPALGGNTRAVDWRLVLTALGILAVAGAAAVVSVVPPATVPVVHSAPAPAPLVRPASGC
jgi:uncharacterized membrane protein YedE/YeeE